MRVIRERMVELDFKQEFIEKILKDYSTKKIEENLDLLLERRNIQNPVGWLKTALKNDYRGDGQGEGNSILSTEEARERFHSLREQLMAMSGR